MAVAASVETVQDETEPQILVIELESQLLAQHALQAALALQDEGQLVVHDAVVLSGTDTGAEVVASMDPSVIAAAVPASLLGAVVGTLVAGPLGLLLGGALAGGSGALLAKLADTGIPAHVVEQVRAIAADGQYVLVLLLGERQAGSIASYAMRCGTVGRSTIMAA